MAGSNGNDIKSIMLGIIGAVIVIAFISSIASKPKICEHKGCERGVDESKHYCFVHNTESDYNKKVHEIVTSKPDPNAPRYCWVDGCFKQPGKDHLYCEKHECNEPDCLRQKKNESDYCDKHKDPSTRSDYKKNEPGKSSGKTSGKTSSKSSTDYEMPDCDDYEDYDEFMDDWDGCMPDGSDAEDYWDNW